jgi:hypothetical protein
LNACCNLVKRVEVVILLPLKLIQYNSLIKVSFFILRDNNHKL